MVSVDSGGFPRRIFLLILLILAWTMFWNSGSAFSTGDPLEGAIAWVVALGLFAILIDGRAVRALEGREVPGTAILILVLIAFVVVYGEVSQLFKSKDSVLGEPYLPGILSLIRSVGSLLLTLLLIWETIRLAKRRST